MCLYTHIIVGALAGSAAPHAALAPLLGLGSHIVLDYVPHYDFERVSSELFFGGAALLLLKLAGVLDLNAFLGGLFGALPDLENLLWKWGILPEHKKIFLTHSGIIPHGREVGPRNLILQTMLAAASVLVMIGMKGFA
ncbi:MAG: hypothetical protein HY770_06450 [Chitinivibrionia bacterium]|nr:hypothetical protein [Chitinivibrionia bacterium]